jgi:glucokinase
MINLVGAVDIGGTKIAVGLVDAQGRILQQEVVPSEPEKGFEDGLGRIRRMLDACLQRQPDAHLLGVGVGATGPVDPDTGVLGPNSFFPSWEGLGMTERLKDLLGTSVAIENDADAAALGETAWGAGRGASRCLYVTVSTGIGTGLVIDGHLYRGAGGAHPEMGHQVIDPARGPQCFCGAKGCWESLAGGPAFAAWYTAQARERRLELSLAGDRIIDAREVCLRAEQGDPLAQEAVLREGYYLGLGLANLVTNFVPDVIVLGGGVMQSWHMFEGQVRAIIRQTCGLVPHERTDLRLASLGTKTGLAGAARVWFHRYG